MIPIQNHWRVKSASNYSKSMMQQGDMYRDMCSKVTSSEESPPAINATAPSEEHRLQYK
jgi:hypothetical protein